MPLGGEGDLVLFVADALDTSIAEGTLDEYLFDVDADAGLDLRATLSWIDPPATATSAIQLVHNLDLVVASPDGTTYRMWGSDTTDNRNVNERVIVDATDVVTGTWTGGSSEIFLPQVGPNLVEMPPLVSLSLLSLSLSLVSLRLRSAFVAITCHMFMMANNEQDQS